MAYALIANTGNSDTADTVTTAAIDTTGANLIVIVAANLEWQSPTLSDSKTNTWTPLTSSSDPGNERCTLFYAFAPTVGSGHTFTLAVANSYPSLCVAAFAGSVASPFDVENGAVDTSGTSVQPGSVTPGFANELVIAGISFNHGLGTTPAASLGIDAGFTLTDFVPPTSGVGHFGNALAYLIETSIAAQNPAWSWTNNANVAVRIATFKAGTVAATAGAGIAGSSGVFSPRGTTQPVAGGWA